MHISVLQVRSLSQLKHSSGTKDPKFELKKSSLYSWNARWRKQGEITGNVCFEGWVSKSCMFEQLSDSFVAGGSIPMRWVILLTAVYVKFPMILLY